MDSHKYHHNNTLYEIKYHIELQWTVIKYLETNCKDNDMKILVSYFSNKVKNNSLDWDKLNRKDTYIEFFACSYVLLKKYELDSMCISVVDNSN